MTDDDDDDDDDDAPEKDDANGGGPRIAHFVLIAFVRARIVPLSLSLSLCLSVCLSVSVSSSCMYCFPDEDGDSSRVSVLGRIEPTTFSLQRERQERGQARGVVEDFRGNVRLIGVWAWAISLLACFIFILLCDSVCVFFFPWEEEESLGIRGGVRPLSVCKQKRHTELFVCVERRSETETDRQTDRNREDREGRQTWV